jgi:hypothetical protein
MQMGLTASTRLEAAAAEGDIPGKKKLKKKTECHRQPTFSGGMGLFK